MSDIRAFKPTINKPMSDQSKAFEKNFNKTMTTNKVNLTEVDGLLTEKEQSLKKKIFSLAKMESLVHADPKLSAVYDEMAENGEEKYGYHYNETIMNMIFNDYVLNSPKYLQKYKMAIPKEKKRRDKSGINQLKKAGEEKMKKFNPEFKPKKPELDEAGEPAVKVQFLVNEKDPKNPDVFAYFPEENHDIAGKYKTAYSHIGQHSACHPEYARESRPATPEEYADLKAELENQVGYNLEVINGMNETSSTGSVGGAGMGSGGYATPRAWGGGDLMKGGKSKVMRKPIWKGGTIIQESNYLTDPSGFEKYVNELNKQEDVPELGSQEFNVGDKVFDILHNTHGTVLDNYDNPKDGDRGDIRLDSDGNVPIYQYDEQSNPISYNLIKIENTMNEVEQPIKISTPEELKAYVAEKKARGEKGLMKEDIPLLAGQALYNVAVNTANRLLPIGWNDLPDINSMWDYIDENGGMTHEQFIEAVKEACNDRLSEEGMGLDDLGENKINEKSVSKAQQRFMGMVRGVQKGEINPNEVGGKVKKTAQNMKPSDVKDFAKTKHDELPEKVDENPMLAAAAAGAGQAVGNRVADKIGLEEHHLESREDKCAFIKKAFYKLTSDTTPNPERDKIQQEFLASLSDEDIDRIYDSYENRLKEIGVDPMSIEETDQSMIDANPQTMANKPNPVGDLGSGVEMGMRGMNEANSELDSASKLLEELNNELNAFSIHHDKLKRMSEDRKPATLVMKDRLGDENKANFKKDLQHSGTKEIIDVEKELQWKDQQTDVPKDPQKLGQDIEKAELKATDGNALENVGDSANDKGNEIPKRNLKTKEQEEVDMYRLGQQSLVYDNEPGKRFEDRMKADMGEEMSKIREKQLKFRGEAPMYNKDPQPIEDTTSDKVQFNKEQSGWNEREGLKESMITGRYHDVLNKRRLIDFTLDEVQLVETIDENYHPLDFTGLGNAYHGRTSDYRVSVNETVVSALDSHKFFTDGKQVFAMKNPVQKLNENEQREEKPVVSEQVNKMKHLLGYKPESFTNTTNVKKNRGF